MKSFGIEECSSQNPARCRVGTAQCLCVNRHHLEVPAPTNSALGLLTFSSDLKVRKEFMSSKSNEIWFLMELHAFSLNLLLSTFSIKHPLGKAEVTHVLISQHSMNKTCGCYRTWSAVHMPAFTSARASILLSPQFNYLRFYKTCRSLFISKTLCEIWFKFVQVQKLLWKDDEDRDQKIETACCRFFSLEMEFDFRRANCNTICLNPAESYKLISWK